MKEFLFIYFRYIFSVELSIKYRTLIVDIIIYLKDRQNINEASDIIFGGPISIYIY